MMKKMGFTSFLERIDAKKIRGRSKSFNDHFGQAALFYNSQSEVEKKHLTDALRFELSKVQSVEIRQRMVNILTQVDKGLADNVAAALGLKSGVPEKPINHGVPPDADPKDYESKKVKSSVDKSASLSM